MMYDGHRSSEEGSTGDARWHLENKVFRMRMLGCGCLRCELPSGLSRVLGTAIRKLRKFEVPTL